MNCPYVSLEMPIWLYRGFPSHVWWHQRFFHIALFNLLSTMGQYWPAGWWFGIFFIFPYIGNNNPNWLIFFKMVKTTNQPWFSHSNPSNFCIRGHLPDEAVDCAGHGKIEGWRAFRADRVSFRGFGKCCDTPKIHVFYLSVMDSHGILMQH